MKKSISFIVVLLISTLSLAHEFWLQPKKFHLALNEEVKIDFFVGENFTGEYWDMTRHKVEMIEALTAYGKKNLAAQVKPTKGNNLAYKPTTDGGHLIYMKSNAAYIELDGAKFNAYLEEDGMEDILARRKKMSEMEKPSRENYTRYAKVLLQAGTRDDEIYRRKVGFPVEIIPQSNPNKLKTGDYLECLALYDGKPAAHQMVKVWNIIGNRAFLQDVYTENDGKLKFPISNNGPWMVSFVKIIPSQKQNIDYESMWASYVFGVE